MTLIKFVLNALHSWCVQIYFHQVWARLEQQENWPDLDLGWPSSISFLMFVPHSRHIQVYFHQVWVPNGPRWNLTCLWPWMTLTNHPHNVRFILPSHFFPSRPIVLGPIEESLNFTWPLTLRIPDIGSLGAPNKHKLTLPGTKLHPPTKFCKCGSYHLRENRRTGRQTDRLFPASYNRLKKSITVVREYIIVPLMRHVF